MGKNHQVLSEKELINFSTLWALNYGTGVGPEDKAKMLDATRLSEEQVDQALDLIAAAKD